MRAKKTMNFSCRFFDYGGDFGSIFGAVWGVWGVAEFRLRLQADFNLSFHTPCTPGRGAADKKSVKNQCKFDARKRDAKNMKHVSNWSQNGSRNLEKVYQKSCPKIDAKKGLDYATAWGGSAGGAERHF